LEAYQVRYAELFADPVCLYRLTQEEMQLRAVVGAKPTPVAQGPAGRSPADGLVATCLGFEVAGGRAPVVSSDQRKTREASALPRAGGTFLGFGLLAGLGRGGFGTVFLASQPALAGRLVALKVAPRLFNESQTLAQLQHTNIVPIYSFHHGQPYQAVCMPY